MNMHILLGNSIKAKPDPLEGAQEYTLLQEYYFCGTPTEQV